MKKLRFYCVGNVFISPNLNLKKTNVPHNVTNKKAGSVNVMQVLHRALTFVYINSILMDYSAG